MSLTMWKTRSWEGAYWVQTRRNEEQQRRSLAVKKAAVLWCYKELERVSAGTRGLRVTAWQATWVAVLLGAPFLGMALLDVLGGGSVSYRIPLAVAVIAALLYVALPIGRTQSGNNRQRTQSGANRQAKSWLPSLSWLSTPALAASIAIALVAGRKPEWLVQLPLLVALVFACHYTSGPWKKFDPGVIRYDFGEKLRNALDTLFVWR